MHVFLGRIFFSCAIYGRRKFVYDPALLCAHALEVRLSLGLMIYFFIFRFRDCRWSEFYLTSLFEPPPVLCLNLKCSLLLQELLREGGGGPTTPPPSLPFPTFQTRQSRTFSLTHPPISLSAEHTTPQSPMTSPRKSPLCRSSYIPKKKYPFLLGK